MRPPVPETLLKNGT